MTQVSGLKRSMPCEDLCSMMVPTSGLPSSSLSSVMKPHVIMKDYDSDDASATSCMELTSFMKLNSRILASSYIDQGDTFNDDVWDFQVIDVGNQSSKRQKRNSDMAALCPATEALTLVLEETQVTLDKLMDMHIHRVSPIEPHLVHPFADLTRFTGRTMV